MYGATGSIETSAVVSAKRSRQVDTLMDALIEERAEEGTREGCLPLVSSGGLRGSVLVEVVGKPAGTVPRSVISP